LLLEFGEEIGDEHIMLVNPKVEQVITVMLPNELTRATVTRVFHKDLIEAKLDQGQPFSRLHNFQFGQSIIFERKPAKLGVGDIWESVGEAPKVVQAPVQARNIAPPDEDIPLPPRPKIKQKARRRSDVEAEKAKVKKDAVKKQSPA
jgi:hypothetical protein